MSRSATPVSRNGTGSLAGVSDSNGGVFEEDDIRRYASNKMPLPGWNRQKYLERDQLSCNKPSAGRGAFSPSADKAVQRTITAELQPFEAVTLFHGVRRKVRIPLERRVLQVVFNRLTQHILTVDSRGITSWIENAVSILEPHLAPCERVKRILPALQSDQIVAICGETTIKLLNSNLAEVFVLDADTTIRSAEYNESTHSLITCGGSHICRWEFVKGNRELRLNEEGITIPASLLAGHEVTGIHLEVKKSRSQRCFAIVHRSVLVYCLYNGELIASLKNAHSREVTCVFYSRVVKLLCTASRDGSVHIWDESFNLQQSYIGHTGAVNAVQPYPHGPLILTASQDETIRVWNLLNGTEVDRLPTGHPVDGLVAHANVDVFVSKSPACIDIWKMNYLYHLLTPMDISINHLYNTQHPDVPMRLVVESADSAIRIVSPETGDILNVALLPVKTTVVSTLYEAQAERLYVLTGDGVVERFDTSCDPPARKLTPWPIEEIGEVTTICLYEFIMDKEAIHNASATDRWFTVALDGGHTGHPGSMEKTMLFAGNRRGQVMVIGQRKKIQKAFVVKGHSSPVHRVVCSPKLDRLVSASETDRNVCIWRVFPYCEEALSLLQRLTLIHPPSELAVCQQRLCIAWDHDATADYSLQMYDLVTKERFTHTPDVDHSDSIVNISTLESLGLVATASQAGEMRIWTVENELVRIIHLNAIPQALAFCSYEGDIAVAIDGHIYKLKNSMYLPRQMLHMTLAATMAKCGVEHGRPMDKRLEHLDESDQARLIGLATTARGYTPAAIDNETASLEGTVEWREEQLQRREGEQLLMERDLELEQLRDGTYVFQRKKSNLTMKQKTAALKALRNELTVHSHPRPVIDSYDKFDPDDRMKHVFMTEVQDQPHMPALANINKFFPPLSSFEPPYPIAPDCFLPNSIVLKEMRKSLQDQQAAEEWKLKPLTEEQLAALPVKKPVIEEEEEEEVLPPTNTGYMDRLRNAMKEEKVKTPEPTPPPTPPPEPVKERVVKPKKPITKLIAPKARPKTPPPPPSPSPPPPKEPTPPPTPPPPPPKLPQFIRRELHRTFMPEYFPGSDEYTFPEPHTLDGFVRKLVSVLMKGTTLRTKLEVLEVLHTLSELQWKEKETKPLVVDALLTHLVWQPAASETAEDCTKFQSLLSRLLTKLGVTEDMIVVQLMIRYILAEGKDEKTYPMQRMLSLGLADDRTYFARELNSWIIDRSPEAGTIKVRRQAEDWLSSWRAKSAVERMKKMKSSTMPSRKADAGKVTELSAMDVINFYVTFTAHQEDLARLRARPVTPPRPPPPKPPSPVPGASMAVVPLPQVPFRSLARFGETHCSKCHPERESTLATTFHLPPINQRRRSRHHQDCLLHGFPRAIRLPVKPQTLRLQGSDDEDEADSGLGESNSSSSSSVLISTKKFFMPEQSLVPELRRR